MGRLEGKVAIVTGANRGIGKAISLLFAREGARVAVLVRDGAGGDAVVDEIRAEGGTALRVMCDVGNPSQIVDAVSEVVAAFGTVDILVNNAFDAATINSSVLDATRETISSQFNTGFFAALTFMQACYAHMEKTGGCVINFGSPAAMAASPTYLPYSATKEAIRALSRTAAREWASKNIRVNVLSPVAATNEFMQSFEAPPQIILGRIGSAEKDVAPVALFLASEDSRYMTGYTLNADGGTMIDPSR